MVHITHNKATGRLKVDKYNISFIRFFRLHNFFLALAGSIIGCLIFICARQIPNTMMSLSIGDLYALVIYGGVAFFIFLAAIAYLAGNPKKEACRLAGRRGLFTFSTMLAVSIASLAIAGRFNWDLTFEIFLKELISIMMLSAIFAVPMDYGISFLMGVGRKKRLTSL